MEDRQSCLSVRSVRGRDRLDASDAVVSFANTGFRWASNTGPCIDIFAPGFDLRATGRDGTEVAFEGTSGAAPHVAGLVAMRLEKYGYLGPTAVESSIKEWSTASLLTGVPPDTPNLLMYTLTPRTRVCCSY